MREVKIEELEVGDEILISCQSYFKFLRVLVKPTISKKINPWTKNPIYKGVKCSSKKSIIPYSGYDMVKWEITPEDHNFTQYVYLQGRNMLLLNR